MNIPFFLPNVEQDARFAAEAKVAGLLSLKGHKALGGIRASSIIPCHWLVYRR